MPTNKVKIACDLYRVILCLLVGKTGLKETIEKLIPQLPNNDNDYDDDDDRRK